MNIQKIHKDLFNLSDNGIFRMSKIQDWIFNYLDLYENTYDYVYSQHLYKNYDGSTIRLPPCGDPSDEDKFLGLYEALNRILNIHKNEGYFEDEIGEFYKIIDFPCGIKAWIAKNVDLGAKEYVSFMLDYLDYDENDRIEHLKIYIPNSKEFEIYVDRQDFKNTINFLEVFNELYWVREILHH